MYKLKVGDLLFANGTYGLVTKVRSKTFQYYSCHSNPDMPGAFMNAKKELAYNAIDAGECKHHLGSTKYRRKR